MGTFWACGLDYETLLIITISCACGFVCKNLLYPCVWVQEFFSFVPAGLDIRMFCLRTCLWKFLVPVGLITRFFLACGLYTRIYCVCGLGSINFACGVLYCSCLSLGLYCLAWLLSEFCNLLAGHGQFWFLHVCFKCHLTVARFGVRTLISPV